MILPASSYTPAACLSTRLSRVLLFSIFAIFLVVHPARADDPLVSPPVSAEVVDKCVQKAIDYLFSQQKDGIWDPPQRQPDKDGRKDDIVASWGNWGGPTSVITYALLAAGESPNSPRLKTAIAFLKTAQVTGTYAVGLRSQVWAHLPITPEIRTLIRRDAELLHASMINKGPSKGLWWYGPHSPDIFQSDFSNSQYGVLGLWGAADAGMEINVDVWRMMDKAWRDGQNTNGGWAYKKPDDPTQEDRDPRFTMTAAGVATLYLTDDYIAPGLGINCTDNRLDPNIEKGLTWLGDNFENFTHADDHIIGAFNYGLYGLSRVGVASGRKYLGKVDWYQYGVNALLKSQAANGGWRTENGPYIAQYTTALSLLFLGYGRASVAVDKLQWETQAADHAADKAADKSADKSTANWNERPRDAANFCRWMSKETESEQKWQVVSLRESAEQLHDAPLLYMSGNQTLNLSPDDEQKLKTFVQEGGTIVGNANCASREFSDSFRKLGEKLFPAYEFRELPADHLIYTAEQFGRTKWRVKPSVLSLSNGVREMMMLIPAEDVSRAWQLQDTQSKAEAFQLFTDIVLYASDQSVLQPSADSYIVAADPKVTPDKTIKLARLQYDGNWDPEPAGWARLTNYLHNSNRVGLTVEIVKLGDGKLDAGVYPIAHLTGTSAFSLTASQQDELKKYLDAGGTLIVDAAGGAAAFATAAERWIPVITPPGSKLAPLEASNPSMTGVKGVTLRRFELGRVGKSKATLPLDIEINGRSSVVYSAMDLSEGLVGEPIDGIAGYDPATATQIVSSLISFAAHK